MDERAVERWCDAVKETVNLEERYIVLSVPSSTLELNIEAKVYKDGQVLSVGKKLSFDEVRDAMYEAEMGYLPPDATFQITDKGLKDLQSFNKDQ